MGDQVDVVTEQQEIYSKQKSKAVDSWKTMRLLFNVYIYIS